MKIRLFELVFIESRECAQAANNLGGARRTIFDSAQERVDFVSQLIDFGASQSIFDQPPLLVRKYEQCIVNLRTNLVEISAQRARARTNKVDGVIYLVCDSSSE